jgi:ribosomal protein S18 acetylase RimI-like enzyme
MRSRPQADTENICVRRTWRRQGLAKALIASSLYALKERGMTEAALGVDAENISGALHLYKFMGFQVVKQSTIYRKRPAFECLTLMIDRFWSVGFISLIFKES